MMAPFIFFLCNEFVEIIDTNQKYKVFSISREYASSILQPSES